MQFFDNYRQSEHEEGVIHDLILVKWNIWWDYVNANIDLLYNTTPKQQTSIYGSWNLLGGIVKNRLFMLVHTSFKMIASNWT